MLFCEYLRAPLGDEIHSFILEMSMMLDLYNVVCCVYGFGGCYACIFLVCRSSLFGGTPSQAWVIGGCLVVGGFRYWEAIMIYVFVSCGVDDLGMCCCVFR